MWPESPATNPVGPASVRGLSLRGSKLFPLRVALLPLLAAFSLSSCSGHGGEEAFIGDRSVTLWTSLAQVRQPVATLHYGERVLIVERKDGQVRVRTELGAEGWTEQRNVMDSELWHRAGKLLGSTRELPVQARASAEKLTNVHIDAGRDSPRIYQLRSGTPLEVLGRAVAEFTKGGTDEGAPPETKREDWTLIRAQEDPSGEVAGWVLRRFVKYEIPPELVDYSTQFRFVAWFELSRVTAGEAALPGGGSGRPSREAPGPPESVRASQSAAPREKPQFLVAGITGPDGQACDFTLIRVYTWGAMRRRYETAYVESNLCGNLPILPHQAGAQVPSAGFSFVNLGRGGVEHREYVMRQTSVHRTDRRPGAERPSRGPR